MRRAHNSMQRITEMSVLSRVGAVRLAAAALCTLALVACGKKEAPEADDDPKVSGQTITFPESVRTLPGIVGQPVKAGGERMISMPGRLVWDEDKTVRVSSPFAGRVMEILVQPGTAVKAGQPLALLTSPDFGVAQADARKAAADSAYAQKSLTRQRELYDAGVIAQKDFEQAQADSARAMADLQRTRRRCACTATPATMSTSASRCAARSTVWWSSAISIRAWNCVPTSRPARRCS